MIPKSVEDAFEARVNALIADELRKIPSLVGHVIPGLAGLLVGQALSIPMVQNELAALVQKGADFAIEEGVKAYNSADQAVLDFIHSHPVINKLYQIAKPTLTSGQTLALAADEAKAIETMVLAGARPALRQFLGLP